MRVPNPPAKPLLVFDGDCGFCRTWIARWRRTVGEQVDFEPFQTASVRFPTIPRSRFRQAVQLIAPDGEVFAGAEAVFRSLALDAGGAGGAGDKGRRRRWLAIYLHVPGARPVFEWGYRWVADHRPALTRISRFLFGPPLDELGSLARLAQLAQDGEIGPTMAVELAAARRRRLALGAGLGAVLLLGGLTAWRRRSRRRHA